jgi:hypothetical protein
MITEILNFVFQMFQANSIVAIAALFLLIIIAYKIFQVVIKSLITGALAALIPIAAVIAGVDIGAPLTISNLLWFAVFGVMSYIIYFSLTTGLKTIRLIMKPVGRLFQGKKEKVIIREVIKDEED